MFNEGDWIVCIEDSPPFFTKGKAYQVNGDSTMYGITSVVGVCDDRGNNVFWYTHKFLKDQGSSNSEAEFHDLLTIYNDSLSVTRKKEGLCPHCGQKGYFSHFALVCSEHGEY